MTFWLAPARRQVGYLPSAVVCHTLPHSIVERAEYTGPNGTGIAAAPRESQS
ncbi:MAG: hypothetical protein OXN89_10635 [Bryobacterales bacterium]|nr:hypothetical protein [Bryobacterales bacterium]